MNGNGLLPADGQFMPTGSRGNPPNCPGAAAGGVGTGPGRCRRAVRQPSGLYEAVTRAAHRADPTLAPALAGLLVVPEGKRVSELERLRTPPVKSFRSHVTCG